MRPLLGYVKYNIAKEMDQSQMHELDFDRKALALGRRSDEAMTRRAAELRVFYAERIDGCGIAERGIFISLDEFAPYRLKGWSGTKETDSAVDELLRYFDYQYPFQARES